MEKKKSKDNLSHGKDNYFEFLLYLNCYRYMIEDTFID